MRNEPNFAARPLKISSLQEPTHAADRPYRLGNREWVRSGRLRASLPAVRADAATEASRVVIRLRYTTATQSTPKSLAAIPLMRNEIEILVWSYEVVGRFPPEGLKGSLPPGPARCQISLRASAYRT